MQDGDLDSLTLLLPAQFFDHEFLENEEESDFRNPGGWWAASGCVTTAGRTWNRLHEKFSQQAGIDSRAVLHVMVEFMTSQDLERAIQKGAEVVVVEKHFDRMFRMVDLCNVLWVEDASVQGEAADLWSRFQGRKEKVVTKTKIRNPLPTHWSTMVKKSVPSSVIFSHQDLK